MRTGQLVGPELRSYSSNIGWSAMIFIVQDDESRLAFLRQNEMKKKNSI